MYDVAAIRPKVLLGVSAAALVGLLLSGCTSGENLEGPNSTPTSRSVEQERPSKSMACGIKVEPTDPSPGSTIEVSGRVQANSDPDCSALLPDSTQLLVLSPAPPSRGEDSDPVAVQVTEDGVFVGTIEVPRATPLGQAEIGVIASSDMDCPPATPECSHPSLFVTVAYPDADLSPVDIVNRDLPAPDIDYGTTAEDEYKPWAISGPRSGEITIVIYGTSCETRPVAFLRTSPSDVLELVSEEISPAGINCETAATLWATVIAVPDEYQDPRVIRVDNVEALQR